MNIPFSFEFFPPKTDTGFSKLLIVADELKQLQPEFFSVTYGAGGSSRDNTRKVVDSLHQQGMDVASHLSFGGDDEESMKALLADYQQLGINKIVALRGDIPSGMGGMTMVYANELVAFIKKHTGDHFDMYVGAYPEIHPDADSYAKDIFYLKQKLDAGAKAAITQYFYNIDAYFYFMEECNKQGISQPVIPGVMPIINFTNLKRFSKNCGADIPRWISQKMADYGDDQASVQAFGLEVVTRLCENLIDQGAPALHFYTMNQAGPTQALLNNLGKSFGK